MALNSETDEYAAMDMTDSDEDLAIIDKADVSNYNPDHILPESPAVLQQIRKWLEPTPYLHEGGEYRRHLASHAKGTGHWLTATETYQKWHTGNADGLLWIRGIPGSGKSVFAAMLADALAREGHPVLFFFFRQIIDANHEPVNMLRDWLDQVLEYSPPLQQDLKAYIDEDRRDLNRHLESIGTDQLWDHLKTALAHLPRVYLVADALDEMGRGNDECLKALARLGLWRPGQVKVLLTSRPVNTVEAPLREFPMLRIRLEERLVDTDIATFVQHSLASSAIPAEDRALVEAAVPGRANGLFLYAKLAMDAFLKPDAEVRQVLGKLPADLNAMYTNLLAEHAKTSGVSEDTQRLLLCWVTHAIRPLRLLEMAEMLRVTYYGKTLSADTEDLMSAKALVRAACGPLLEIHPDETVSVVHHSLTEFLRGSTRSAADEPPVGSSSFPILMPGPTNEQLALSCIHYLQSSGCLDMRGLSGVSKTEEGGPARFHASIAQHKRQRALRLEFPFADYASNNWAKHAARSFNAESDPPSTDLISALDGFLVPGPRLKAWLGLEWQPGAAEDVTASHIAARYGLTRYIEHLFHRDGATAVTCVTSKLQTPLFYAAVAGRADTVKLLIASGADPNPEDDLGHTPLHLAAQNNRPGVVEVLLSAGVDPLTPRSRKGNTTWRRDCRTVHRPWPGVVVPMALMYACQGGHTDVVGALLPWLHDMNVVQQALDCASRAGKSKVVKRLISHPGVDVNAMVYGHTALFHACECGDVESIEALVLAGADASLLCPGGDGEFGTRYPGPMSPLEIFCSSRRHRDDGPVLGGGGLERVLDLLLGAGADIHRRDYDFRTPLHRAAGRPALFRLLLRAGADPNAESSDGGTLLHMELGSGDDEWELIKLLVREGNADINQRQRSDGRTPVVAMADGRNISTCRRFIEEFGPDCTIADNAGDTALHKAVELWESPIRDELIDTLLAAGAQVNQRNRRGETPLHVADWSAVERLVSRGADLEARNYEGATPLMRSLHRRVDDGKHIDLLLRMGARLDTTDFAGRTLIHEMVSSMLNRDTQYRLEDLQHIVELLGPNASQVDHAGNTALHELAAKHQGQQCNGNKAVAILKYLVERGVDPDAVNHGGQTMLHRLGGGLATNILLLDAAIAACSKETLDLADHKGWRPIHHAVSTANSHVVARLMGAGADLSAPTYDGHTVLHLAGNSNILGMIITELTTAARYRDVTPTLVDAKNNEGHVPLFYACRAGQPDSVALLLDAGAEVKHSSGALLRACTLFERADRHRTQVASDALPKRSKGAVVEPQTFWGLCSGHNTLPHFHTRLNEILDLLVAHGLDHSSRADEKGRTHLRASLDAVSDSNMDHTVRCLSALAPKAKGEGVPPADAFVSFTHRWAEIRREAATQAFSQTVYGSLAKEDRKLQEHLLVRLLERREFDLVDAAVKLGVCDPFLPSEGGKNLLHVLVSLGHASLLAKIATPEGVRRLDDVEWLKREYEDRTEQDREWCSEMDPFVLAACQRAAPNMPVLRFLVDEMKASVDAGHQEDESGYGANINGDLPLHALAMGHHWWQAYQALPYLLSRKPNLEARDRDGNTPLQRAINSRPGHNRSIGLFQKHAVKLLAAAGANVNAVTRDGKTCLCLAAAGGDVELIQLLIAHGATVTVPAVLAAIDNYHVRGLEVLLSAHETPGDGDVTPSSPGQLPEFLQHDGAAVLDSAATVVHRRETGDRFKNKREASAEMVQLLLAHGADLFGTFMGSQPVDSLRKRRGTKPKSNDNKKLPLTVFHNVLFSNGTIEPFLQLSPVDLEHRNSTGQTLLLAACASNYTLHRTITLPDLPPQSLIIHLLHRGADPSATDTQARNALHTALSATYNTPGLARAAPTDPSHLTTLIQALLTHSPDPPLLLNTPDKSGSTPLHHALATTPYIPTHKRTTAAERIATANAFFDTLFNAGADARYVNPLTGNTALHLLGHTLVRDGRVGAALLRRFVSELGLDVNAKNLRGETVVSKVFEGGLGDGTGVWCWDRDEEEGLERGEEAVWQVLKEVGVDFGVRDCEGRGLLHVVAERADLRSAKVFGRLQREWGLDPMGLDNRLRTSLDVATACGNCGVLGMFGREEVRESDEETDL